MVCPSSPTYQVTIDANGNFQGYAWSDAMAGLISTATMIFPAPHRIFM